MADNSPHKTSMGEALGGQPQGPEQAGRLASAERLLLEQSQKIEQLRRQLTYQDTRIACIQELGAALSTTNSLDEVLNVIMEKITVLMNADRSTLFLLDPEENALWSKIIQGDQINEIRLRVGDGIAGWVAQTGKSVNIRDAYRDDRFNASVDLRTGYQTRSILCQPIRNLNRQIIGVVQVLNSKNGHFTVEDENLLSAIASQASISIENSKLYLSVVSKNLELTETQIKLEKKVTEVDRLYEIQALLTTAIDLESLIRSAADKMLDIIKAGACAVTIRESDHLRLFVLQRQKHTAATEFNIISVPPGRGISAMVMDTGAPYICNTGKGACAEQSDTLGMPVRSIIAVPLFAEDRCIGTMELMNKRGPLEPADIGNDELEMRPPSFDDDDVKLLSLMAGQISRAVATTLYRERQEKANRLASIGQMLSGVIHDFKTPVTIISGYVQLMAAQNDGGVRQEYAQSVLKQFDQLNKMTREVLAFARGESSILLRKVFLHKVADDLRELLARDLGDRGVEVEIQCNYRGAAKMDEVKIKRAITNLARNAAEAMPQGGRFQLTIDRDDDDVVLVASDNGPGIPVEIRENLFESFVTQGKEQGTGLGLAIVKKVVEDHKGTVEYETHTGQGTTFTLRFPIDND